MGARNLSYRAALGIMAGMIAVAVLLGGGRSLRALRSDVEAVFWNGADGDGIGIASDLSKNSADAINLLSVARGYDVASDALDGLQSAVDAMDAAGRDISGLYAANTELTRSAAALYEDLGRQPLSERDEGYRQSLYHNILSRNDTMGRDPYNEQALAFNQALKRFPANLLGAVTFVQPAPLFR